MPNIDVEKEKNLKNSVAAPKWKTASLGEKLMQRLICDQQDIDLDMQKG